jgi:raffinose synthase
VTTLSDGGTPARFVIIDDGWQSVQPDDIFKKKVDHISGMPPIPWTLPPNTPAVSAAATTSEGGSLAGEVATASVSGGGTLNPKP